MTILINLMFRRLDKFDGGPLFGGRGFIFGMLIGLHIWGGYIQGGSSNSIIILGGRNELA